MIVPDTSAWIEFLRGTGHEVHLRMVDLIKLDADIVLTEVVLMELLAGPTSDDEVTALRSTLIEFPVVPARSVEDHEQAAAVYRVCRTHGETVRSLNDCLIAAIAIRTGSTVLHADRDFGTISRHTPLQVEPAQAG